MNGQASILGIQYMRAVAAVLVVVAHGGSLLPAVADWTHGGVAGVDVFFVVSGFIMAHTTRHFDGSASAKEAATFMWRRVLRIVPLYWLALLWTIKVPLANGQVSLDYARDFLFIPRTHSSGQTWPELVVGWTLNYEMFFYAAFALAMLFGRWRYWALVTLFIALVAVRWIKSPGGTAGVFYTEPVILEFLFGVALHQVTPQMRAPRPVALGILVAGFMVLLQDNGNLNRVVADGIPAVAIVWAAVQLNSAREMRWLRWIGDSSYSIYLFHLATFSLIERAIRSGLQLDAVPAPVALLVLTGLAVGVGLAIHVLVETPLLNCARRMCCKPSRATVPLSPTVDVDGEDGSMPPILQSEQTNASAAARLS